MNDAAVLAFDLWAGECDSDARTLRDAMIVTRHLHECAICFEVIPAGSRVRAQTQVSREMGKVMTFRVCPACCVAIEQAVLADDDDLINRRTAMGIARVERRRVRGQAALF